mmetsp:Transcript_30131/g.76142  ORF Transcript_30131/g.76142 Transcript_30131/m.76142 type:complete len:282 (+) Transcript_30131:284-1129(+)
MAAGACRMRPGASASVPTTATFRWASCPDSCWPRRTAPTPPEPPRRRPPRSAWSGGWRRRHRGASGACISWRGASTTRPDRAAPSTSSSSNSWSATVTAASSTPRTAPSSSASGAAAPRARRPRPRQRPRPRTAPQVARRPASRGRSPSGNQRRARRLHRRRRRRRLGRCGKESTTPGRRSSCRAWAEVSSRGRSRTWMAGQAGTSPSSPTLPSRPDTRSSAWRWRARLQLRRPSKMPATSRKPIAKQSSQSSAVSSECSSRIIPMPMSWLLWRRMPQQRK